MGSCFLHVPMQPVHAALSCGGIRSRLAHKGVKLTRRNARDAEGAEDEQQKSLHGSSARTLCGPIYSGRGSCANRRTGALTGFRFGSDRLDLEKNK